MSIAPDHYLELCREVFRGRRWVVAVDVLAGTKPTVDLLRRLGAERPFAIGASRGTGPIPSEDEAEVAELDVRSDSMMGGIRASARALKVLEPTLQARIDRWDPDGEAQVLGTIFGDGEPIGDRQVFGARPRSWQALEDKTVIDALWDRVGVPRVSCRVVPIDGLRAAARDLDRGHGTVWAGDAREGFHGGAAYTRWIRTEADAAEAEAVLGPDCDTARVMPFLEGIPCSIHGIVFGDYVVALRPCEMVVLRSPDHGRFTYARSATFWDPPPADAEDMREIARAVGRHLRSQVGYRGAFTIDGIMTAEGFRPTELNPRIGAALAGLCKGIPDLPLLLLNRMLVEGHDLDYRPEALERLILGHASLRRSGMASVVSRQANAPEELDIVFDGSTCREARAGEERDLQMRIGASSMGSYLAIVLEPERTPVGPSVAPRVVAALAFANTRWSLGLGTLVPARDVRKEAP